MTRSPYARTRNRQLVRTLRLLALMQEGWCDLAGLSRELSVSGRTIRRDLMALEEAHLPVQKVRGDDRIARWAVRWGVR